tara:strand:- start:461 stop:886 length:426 start_codon:yes stop_codon:yes gene_type:complete
MFYHIYADDNGTLSANYHAYHTADDGTVGTSVRYMSKSFENSDDRDSTRLIFFRYDKFAPQTLPQTVLYENMVIQHMDARENFIKGDVLTDDESRSETSISQTAQATYQVIHGSGVYECVKSIVVQYFNDNIGKARRVSFH